MPARAKVLHTTMNENFADKITFDGEIESYNDDVAEADDSSTDETVVEAAVDTSGLDERQKWAVAELAVMVEDLFESFEDYSPSPRGETYDECLSDLLNDISTPMSFWGLFEHQPTSRCSEHALEAARQWLLVAWWVEYGAEWQHRDE